MAKLIYAMCTSLDGYTEDEHGVFDWGVAEDAEAHAYIMELVCSCRIHLYGRREYETMLYWESAPTLAGQPEYVLNFAKRWQATEKIVYSRTLAEPRSLRTRIEREFRPEAVRRLKAGAAHDLAIAGPELAAQAIRAGGPLKRPLLEWGCSQGAAEISHSSQLQA